MDIGAIWVVMACHDRRDVTLRCLRSLAAQSAHGWSMARVVLVDDGSTDGTTDAVRERFPDVVVSSHPPGDLYWGGAMRIGADLAISRGADVLWMVNDDVEFDPDALDRLLDVARTWSDGRGAQPWVIGSTRSPTDGSTTYGGWSREGRVFVRVRRLDAPATPTRCATTSFNSILIPVDQYRALGGFDPHFPHVRSDHDLGYRATRAGYELVIAPGHVGTCASNPPSPWQDPSARWRDRWRDVHSAKWYPPRQSLRYTLRHYGPVGLASFVRPYALMVTSHVRWRMVTAARSRGRRGTRR